MGEFSGTGQHGGLWVGLGMLTESVFAPWAQVLSRTSLCLAAVWSLALRGHSLVYICIAHQISAGRETDLTFIDCTSVY